MDEAERGGAEAAGKPTPNDGATLASTIDKFDVQPAWRASLALALCSSSCQHRWKMTCARVCVCGVFREAICNRRYGLQLAQRPENVLIDGDNRTDAYALHVRWSCEQYHKPTMPTTTRRGIDYDASARNTRNLSRSASLRVWRKSVLCAVFAAVFDRTRRQGIEIELAIEIDAIAVVGHTMCIHVVHTTKSPDPISGCMMKIPNTKPNCDNRDKQMTTSGSNGTN